LPRLAIKSGAAPATVSGEPCFKVPLRFGNEVREGEEGPGPASQETCLNNVIFRRAGCALGAVTRCDDRSCHADGGDRHEVCWPQIFSTGNDFAHLHCGAYACCSCAHAHCFGTQTTRSVLH